MKDTHLMTVAVDAVVFGLPPTGDALEVLLIERGTEPFKGRPALPGGRMEPGENAFEAILRELREEVGIRPTHLEQLYTFSEPDRDPRGRVVSIAHFGLVNTDKFQPIAGSDAAKAAWYKVADAYEMGLVFDHATILQTARDRLRGKIRYTPIGIDLLPQEFTIGDLRRVYDTILGRRTETGKKDGLDPSNFRKRILATGLLVDTGRRRSGQHRPSPLYRFDKRRYALLSRRGFEFEVVS